jgi:hypothetical protein
LTPDVSRPEIRSFDLVYLGNTLVSFVPNVQGVFKVSYESVGLKPGNNNIVRGFLVIETTVGSVRQKATSIEAGFSKIAVPPGTDPDKIDQIFEQLAFEKLPGHYMFKVTESDIRSIPTAAP